MTGREAEVELMIQSYEYRAENGLITQDDQERIEELDQLFKGAQLIQILGGGGARRGLANSNMPLYSLQLSFV